MSRRSRTSQPATTKRTTERRPETIATNPRRNRNNKTKSRKPTRGSPPAVYEKGVVMADGFVHTVFKRGEWMNEIEGGAEFGGPNSTKEDAVSAGRERAMKDKTEHVIHNEDGTISERNSYGNDPASGPG
jgi:hypothetical protein